MTATLRWRLPPVSAALVIQTTAAELARRVLGFDDCAEHGTGAVRRELGAVPEKFDALAFPLDQRAIETARDQARVLLAEICRVCPHGICLMKDW